MYIPTQEDIRWIRNVLAMVNEGGELMMPDAGLRYRISHKNKTFTLLNPEQLAHPFALRTHLQHIYVVAFVDYKIDEDEVTRAAMLCDQHLTGCPICSIEGPVICPQGLYLLDFVYASLIKSVQESGRAQERARHEAEEAEKKKKHKPGTNGNGGGKR